MTMRRSAIVALAALALTVAACGDDDDDTATSETTEAPTATTAAPPDTATEDSTAAPIELTDSSFGEILTSDGRTLYAFVPDGGNGASTCTGGCADTWPALRSEEITVGDGLDQSLFTVADGQVVVDGWPLYFFANDAAAGDTNGQGVGGNWYVVGADGAMIQG
jgi:predicted lipoprotein with Yx(FWY)xxD motif